MRGSFTSDGAPALLENRFGKGRTFWFATTPGISYIKDARIVANALAEKWPAPQRRALTRYAAEANAVPLVKLSEPVVETGIYEAVQGTALVLANFTYAPIGSLTVEVPMRRKVAQVKSLEHGPLKFEAGRASPKWREEGFNSTVRFALPLGIDDMVLIESR